MAIEHERAYLHGQMLYCAFKANCLHDLKRNSQMCGSLGIIEIRIGSRTLLDFPLCDVEQDLLVRDLLESLEQLYKKKFQYYRDEIKALTAGDPPAGAP